MAANDAFGQEIWAAFKEGHRYEVLERDDGFLIVGDGPRQWLAVFRHWSTAQRQVMRFVQGPRILDIGCGAGRVALYIQQKGLCVTAIDNSPGAIRTCKARGVKDARVLPVEEIATIRGPRFSTVVMFGANFGLFGSRSKAQRLLLAMRTVTSDDGRIIAEAKDPYQTTLKHHLRYYRRNLRQGRMFGQIRIRNRFRDVIGPWFDYLFVSPREMHEICSESGWVFRRVIKDGGSAFIAILEKR
jgi:cyclopropane fatty-acyl-phospholipid synthase-like methyltransferase